MKRLLLVPVLFVLLTASLAAQDALLNVNGSLSLENDSESAIEWYSVDSAAGAFLNVDAVSLDFTPVLYVEAADGQEIFGEGYGNAASLTLFSPDGGTYRIGVSFSGEPRSGQGSFILKVSSTDQSATISTGETKRGSLANDAVYNSEFDRSIAWYALSLKDGELIRVLLESDDFDAYLTILLPDGTVAFQDDGDGTNSLWSYQADGDVSLLIGASGYFSDSSGVYFLTVEEMEEPVALEVGVPVRGQLGTDTGIYRFIAPAAGMYNFTLTSPDFDTILKLSGPNGLQLENDDALNDTDSLLSTMLNEGDSLLLTVASWGSSVGMYEITASASEALAADFSTSGDLSGDTEFTYTGEAGDYLMFEVVSNDFDTVLTIINSRGEMLSNDDSSGSEYIYVSRLRYYFDEEETISLSVSDYFSDDAGSFMLRMYRLEGEPPADLADGYELEFGAEVETSISADDEYLGNGPGDTYTIIVEEGQMIVISMNSDEFDPYITLVAPNGQEFSDDDSGGDYNSRLEIAAPVSGTYQLLAMSYNGSYGAYTIGLETAGTASYLLNENGEISDDDAKDIRGNRYDVWNVTLEAGQAVSILLGSNQFDTQLFVNGPDGEMIAENDDYSGSDSRVDLEITETGVYSIVVIPFYESGRGQYSLQILHR